MVVEGLFEPEFPSLLVRSSSLPPTLGGVLKRRASEDGAATSSSLSTRGDNKKSAQNCEDAVANKTEEAPSLFMDPAVSRRSRRRKESSSKKRRDGYDNIANAATNEEVPATETEDELAWLAGPALPPRMKQLLLERDGRYDPMSSMSERNFPSFLDEDETKASPRRARRRLSFDGTTGAVAIPITRTMSTTTNRRLGNFESDVVAANVSAKNTTNDFTVTDVSPTRAGVGEDVKHIRSSLRNSQNNSRRDISRQRRRQGSFRRMIGSEMAYDAMHDNADDVEYLKRFEKDDGQSRKNRQSEQASVSSDQKGNDAMSIARRMVIFPFGGRRKTSQTYNSSPISEGRDSIKKKEERTVTRVESEAVKESNDAKESFLSPPNSLGNSKKDSKSKGQQGQIPKRRASWHAVNTTSQHDPFSVPSHRESDWKEDQLNREATIVLGESVVSPPSDKDNQTGRLRFDQQRPRGRQIDLIQGDEPLPIRRSRSIGAARSRGRSRATASDDSASSAVRQSTVARSRSQGPRPEKRQARPRRVSPFPLRSTASSRPGYGQMLDFEDMSGILSDRDRSPSMKNSAPPNSASPAMQKKGNARTKTSQFFVGADGRGHRGNQMDEPGDEVSSSPKEGGALSLFIDAEWPSELQPDSDHLDEFISARAAIYSDNGDSSCVRCLQLNSNGAASTVVFAAIE